MKQFLYLKGIRMLVALGLIFSLIAVGGVPAIGADDVDVSTGPSISIEGLRVQPEMFNVAQAALPDVDGTDTQGIKASDATGPQEPFYGTYAYRWISSPQPGVAPYYASSVSHTGFASLSAYGQGDLRFDFSGSELNDQAPIVDLTGEGMIPFSDPRLHQSDIVYFHSERTTMNPLGHRTEKLTYLGGTSDILDSGGSVVAECAIDSITLIVDYDSLENFGWAKFEVLPGSALYNELMASYGTAQMKMDAISVQIPWFFDPPYNDSPVGTLPPEQYAVASVNAVLYPAMQQPPPEPPWTVIIADPVGDQLQGAGHDIVGVDAFVDTGITQQEAAVAFRVRMELDPAPDADVEPQAPGDIMTQFPAPGPGPCDLAINGPIMWNIDDTTNTIYMIDAGSGAVVDTFVYAAGEITMPYGLTFDGSFLWATSRDTQMIHQIDPVTGAIIHSIPAPGQSPMGLAWDGTYLWNVDFVTKAIYQLNPADGGVVNSHSVATMYPYGLSWDPITGTLWLAEDYTKEVLRVDPSTGALLDFVSVPGITVDGLAYMPGMGLWVGDYVDGLIRLIEVPGGATPTPTPTPTSTLSGNIYQKPPSAG
ncbi:hypothetical protein ACFLTS_05190, partial [Chloroflexota bacterium]